MLRARVDSNEAAVGTERSAHRPFVRIEYPDNRTVNVGDDVEFKCIVFSDPHPHMRWYKGKINDDEKNWNANVTLLKVSASSRPLLACCLTNLFAWCN